MFEQSMVNQGGRTARPITMSLSIALQIAGVAVALLIPLIFIEPLPRIVLRVPPPVRPVTLVDTGVRHTRAARPPGSTNSRRPIFRPTVLTQPSSIPPAAARIIDDPNDFITDAGPIGPYIPGAIAVSSGFNSGPVIPAPPQGKPPVQPKTAATPVQAPTTPVRVGGVVRQPVLIHQVNPPYPPIARQTRTSGIVRLEAILARDGTIRALSVVSGHPFLTKAALDAVAQWRYEPTLLNGEPVEVVLSIEVNFKLQ